jgi:protease I
LSEQNIHTYESFLGVCAATGIDIHREDEFVAWAGSFGGSIKPSGPLSGKRVAVIVASEFSDFQVYYLVSYIGELGGTCEFLLVDWVKWKFVRPNIADKGVRGMWDLSVDPVPVMECDKAAHYMNLRDANPDDFDVVVVPGGHSADVMVTETPVIEFIRRAADNDAVVGGIAGGIIPLIAAGVVHGKRCTGDRTVDFMLRRIARFESLPVVTDDRLVTARATVHTPEFLRSVAAVVNPDFRETRQGMLAGKRCVFLVGGDFEDIELVVPTMELLYRGAEVIIGTFEPELTSRPPANQGVVAVGNFGVPIPFQEIPQSYYRIKSISQLEWSQFDVVIITGAFNPWNIVATGTTEWLRDAYCAGKTIAGICHGPIPMSAADLVAGRRLTGVLNCKDAVEIMGGTFNTHEWAAAIDGRLVTGRTPPEIPEFVDAISAALVGPGSE